VTAVPKVPPQKLKKKQKKTDSVIGIATGYGLDARGDGVRVSVRSRIFSSPRRSDRIRTDGSRRGSQQGVLLRVASLRRRRMRSIHGLAGFRFSIVNSWWKSYLKTILYHVQRSVLKA
jgi:hypothetical protein